MGFRMNLKWGFSSQSRFFTNSSSPPSLRSVRQKEALYDLSTMSLPSVVSLESETLYNDLVRAHTCSSAPQTLVNDSRETESKTNFGKRSHHDLYNMIDEKDQLTFLTSLQSSKKSHYGLLMENLIMLEETFADTDLVRLERDILVKLKRLGALKLFHTCISRTLESPTSFGFGLCDMQGDFIEESQMNDHEDDHKFKTVVRSGKKEERKSKRHRALKKGNDAYELAMASKLKINHEDLHRLKSRKASNLRSRSDKRMQNEAEMSRGVKLLANLERIRISLEEATGQVPTMSSWAKAAGIEKRELQENLRFGWYCRDELLRSSKTLVVYLARNYGGLGVAFDDLIQAGNFGVLQGAERFDHTRGYKFSTYVHFWIRRSMLRLMAQNTRGIRIPVSLTTAINQIQKARKILSSSNGRNPDDAEIAKFTGLSMAKIAAAAKCPRIVGSIDQKLGDYTNVTFLEVTPDTTLESPENAVMRQHMMKDLYDLLNGLEPRERQVVILRFGLCDHQRKSLAEIGRCFNVTKEWIRKIEISALTKLRGKENLENLSHYLYMQ